VVALEEAKDLSAHNVEEKAFQVKEKTTKKRENDQLVSRGWGRGRFRSGQGRGRDRGRGRNGRQRQYDEQIYTKNNTHCHHCKDIDTSKVIVGIKKMNFATKTKKENKFFMACI